MIERMDELESALRKSGGRAVVLVHPLYFKYHPIRIRGVEVPERPDARNYLRLQQKRVETSKFPVIVFEEVTRVEQTRKALGGRAFFVPTGEYGPRPALDWDVLDFLKQKGLKHGVFGGQAFVCGHFAPTASARKALQDLRAAAKETITGKKMRRMGFQGCVSETMKEFLNRGLQVSLMKNVVFPQKLT